MVHVHADTGDITIALQTLHFSKSENIYIGQTSKQYRCYNSFQLQYTTKHTLFDPSLPTRPCGVMDKALALGSEGCGFESLQGKNFSFCNFPCSMFLSARLSSYKGNQEWHSPEQVHRENDNIEQIAVTPLCHGQYSCDILILSRSNKAVSNNGPDTYFCCAWWPCPWRYELGSRSWTIFMWNTT